ncbi:hypothetical protein GCWU000342_00467 [Shuttleworthella satelles DSM 14600]|uniref:Uncharacterized protein n=1 Tax=Shuttleworthella satelles DSM 14600 TaxID=626523 RepID=C4G917_9FIRM|nr:hypothetical protein GCWU000342_00467 [Shuttleworthia satelles DSM 14600]
MRGINRENQIYIDSLGARQPQLPRSFFCYIREKTFHKGNRFYNPSDWLSGRFVL